MKYDIGDIIVLSSIDKHFIIIDRAYHGGLTFYDVDCLDDGLVNRFSHSTLDRSFKVVQKAKK